MVRLVAINLVLVAKTRALWSSEILKKNPTISRLLDAWTSLVVTGCDYIRFFFSCVFFFFFKRWVLKIRKCYNKTKQRMNSKHTLVITSSHVVQKENLHVCKRRLVDENVRDEELQRSQQKTMIIKPSRCSKGEKTGVCGFFKKKRVFCCCLPACLLACLLSWAQKNIFLESWFMVLMKKKKKKCLDLWHLVFFFYSPNSCD